MDDSVKVGAVYGNRTRIVLIDKQVPHQPAYTAKWPASGDSNPDFSVRSAVSCAIGRPAGTWYGYEESNLNLNVRSVLSCPLNDTRKKLAGRPGLEPGTSAFRARRAANCASGQRQGVSESNARSQLQRLAAYH